MSRLPMDADARVEHQSKPYASRLIASLLVGALVVTVVYWLQPSLKLGVWLAYLIPAFLLYCLHLSAKLLALGTDMIPRGPFLAGVAFVVGGAGLDMIATVINTPSLDKEGNPVARALLDSGHPLWFVYSFALIAQILYALFTCLLWAVFLRHRRTVLSLARKSARGSRLAFIKAAMGGAELSWRQWVIPLKWSELPNSYHVSLLIAAVFAGSFLMRWYWGLTWLDVLPHAREVAMAISIMVPLLVYVAWLWRSFSETTETDAANQVDQEV